jgi:hypothetical protein
MYKIHAPATLKDCIKQPKCVIDNVLPKLCSSIVVIGTSGSGKSVLIQNMLCDKRFYKDVFDHVFLLSPTAELDDIQCALKLPEANLISDIKNDGIPVLEAIVKSQKVKVTKLGAAKAPKICIFLDDCLAESELIKSNVFTKLFVANRHYNIMTIFCSQYYKKLPPVCRLQASVLIFFAISRPEAEMLYETTAPAHMKKKEFLHMISDQLKEKYQFIAVHKFEPLDRRFRQGLGDIINMDFYIK